MLVAAGPGCGGKPGIADRQHADEVGGQELPKRRPSRPDLDLPDRPPHGSNGMRAMNRQLDLDGVPCAELRCPAPERSTAAVQALTPMLLVADTSLQCAGPGTHWA